MSKNKPTYEELKTELGAIMLELQREDLDVDKALEHYQRGLELITAMEKHLKQAGNKVKELKAKFNPEAQ